MIFARPCGITYFGWRGNDLFCPTALLTHYFLIELDTTEHKGLVSRVCFPERFFSLFEKALGPEKFRSVLDTTTLKRSLERIEFGCLLFRVPSWEADLGPVEREFMKVCQFLMGREFEGMKERGRKLREKTFLDQFANKGAWEWHRKREFLRRVLFPRFFEETLAVYKDGILMKREQKGAVTSREFVSFRFLVREAVLEDGALVLADMRRSAAVIPEEHREQLLEVLSKQDEYQKQVDDLFETTWIF